jgi:hypothetical protein
MKKTNLLFALQMIVCIVCIILISRCKKEEPDTKITPIAKPMAVPLVTIGQQYGGGIVFYVDSTGQHGLIAAPTTINAPVKWFNGNYVQTFALGTKVGTGFQNTQAIIASQEGGSYAAFMCNKLSLNGYTDWFLPSKDELYLLYLQKAAGKVDGFVNNFYWSSTETSYNEAWSESFTNGAGAGTDKNGAYYVRAIRAF